MGQIGSPVVGSYDHRLVVLSILVAILASYVALDLAVRVTAARGGVRRAWLAGGAISMGLGIWSMHFVGMLAFQLPIPVRYDVPTVLISLLAAILASGVALNVVSGEKFDRRDALVGGLVMGSGIASMHYLGMAAMRLPATCHYNPLLVGLSIVIAVVASLAALTFLFDFRGEPRRTWAKGTSAAVMGMAIASMHYTGMASSSFVTSNLTEGFSHALSVSWLGIAGIVIVTLMTLGFTLLTTSMGHQVAVQSVELQLSEDRYRLLFEHSLAGVYRTTLDGRVLDCNEAYARTFGYSSHIECLEHNATDNYYTSADWEAFVAQISREKTVANVERRLRTKDGRTVWVLANATLVDGRDGVPAIIEGTLIDITERKRVEEALREAHGNLEARVRERTAELAKANEALRSEIAQRIRVETVLSESEERIHAILENSPNMIFLKDTEGRYLLVNREFQRVLHLSQEQIKGKTDTEVFPPGQAAAFRANDLEVLRARVPMEFEEAALYDDGPHTSIVHRFPLFDSHGGMYAIGGIVTDITERKRAEEARRHSEEQHRMVVETATDAVISINEDSQVLFVNPATTKIFGYESSELIGVPLTILMPEFLRELHKAGLQRYRTTGQRHMNWQGVELTGLRKNREEFPVEVSVGEVVKEGHHIFTGFVRDITERKQAEAELRRLSGRLLRSQDEERRRIAGDLHDSMGQDLVALATMLAQLRGSIPSGERTSRRLLSECKALAERCIREVRTLSYLLHPPVLDQAGLGDAIRDYVKGFSKRSGIQIELELSPSVGRMARDIELALFRVVQESLTNIQRHSGSQRAKIRIHRNSDLMLEISDLGHGVSASVQRGKQGPRFEVGVGILSMQERVKLIGGRLDIDSSSHGTTVRVTIPLGGEQT